MEKFFLTAIPEIARPKNFNNLPNIALPALRIVLNTFFTPSIILLITLCKKARAFLPILLTATPALLSISKGPSARKSSVNNDWNCLWLFSSFKTRSLNVSTSSFVFDKPKRNAEYAGDAPPFLNALNLPEQL